VWAAYRGCGAVAAFGDVARLTCFADYRIPQLLRGVGAMVYAAELAARIDAREELPPGGAAEVELRAATVQAVERLRGALGERGRALTAVEVDWLLWNRGEAERDALPPHHRTLTVFY